MTRLPTLEERLALRTRPNRINVMYQRWESLLFLHWEYPAEKIQQTLPQGLYVDTFEGRAFIGIVPFYMKNIRPCFCPAVPGVSNFLEINLRTYVHDGEGTSGVWFYSLDANQWLAVKIGRLSFSLPYYYATMKAHSTNDGTNYHWQRCGQEKNSHFVYKPISAEKEAEPGTLEFFLAERYILFAERNNQLFTGHVHHRPYPLMKAEVSSYNSQLAELSGFFFADEPMSMLMSKGVDVEVFALSR